MPDERPLLSVIIVSYNTRQMTLNCLRDLYADLAGVTSDVWIVDNNSKDGSAQAIRDAYPQVKLIENETNAGFGAANNLAMRRAQGKYYLLLNSDAFVHSGSVRAMLDAADAHPDAAVLGPRLLNEDGSLQISCYRFPSPGRAWLENLFVAPLLKNSVRLADYRRWPHDAEREVDSVIGACMLVRREAFEQTGGFDERYFMYQEETDWQKTLRARGWKVLFTPAAIVTHLGGASGKDDSVRISDHFFESLDYYSFKHHGLMGLVSLRLAMTIGCFCRATLWTIMMLVPGRRAVAASKSRLHSWLFVRQATHWRLGLRSS